MLYIGNFSYNDETDDKDNYCLMPCVVSADDADEALSKFADRFEELHLRTDLLDGAKRIYLDSLVELEGAPSEAVMTQWQKIVPTVDGLCSITSAMPSDADDLGSIYGYEGDDHDHDHDDDEEHDAIDIDELIEEDGVEEEPFIVFE